jgi:hypothetical protein
MKTRTSSPGATAMVQARTGARRRTRPTSMRRPDDAFGASSSRPRG